MRFTSGATHADLLAAGITAGHFHTCISRGGTLLGFERATIVPAIQLHSACENFTFNLTSATVCGNRTGCTPAAKRSASVAPEVDLRECTLHSPPQKKKKRIRQNPLRLWTPEETSPEIQNRGTSGPKKGHVSAKNFKKKKQKKTLPSSKVSLYLIRYEVSFITRHTLKNRHVSRYSFLRKLLHPICLRNISQKIIYLQNFIRICMCRKHLFKLDGIFRVRSRGWFTSRTV